MIIKSEKEYFQLVQQIHQKNEELVYHGGTYLQRKIKILINNMMKQKPQRVQRWMRIIIMKLRG